MPKNNNRYEMYFIHEMTKSSMMIMNRLTFLILVLNVSIVNGKYQNLLKMDGLPCPTLECECQKNEINEEFILNCRDKKLTKIPTFTKVNVAFVELTFSTSSDRQSLSNRSNRITTIPPRAFTNLKVKRIDLTKNFVSNFTVDAFAGVEENLQELLIEGNGLISIPYSALKQLKNLMFLEIWNFKEPLITANNLIWNFTNLTTLELHNIKNLTHIAEDTFQNKLPKLTSLLIQDVPLPILPVAALSKLNLLTNLKIINTGIFEIFGKSFTNLTQLKEIEIKHNSKLKLLHENCFSGLNSTLQALDLSHNSLSAQQIVNALSEPPMTRLHTLTLSYSYYSYGLNGLPERTFQSLKSLHYLNLVSTKIKVLKAETFYGLTALHTLDLSFNEIKYIEPSLFSFSPTLEELRLNSQNIHDEWLNFPTEAIASIKNSLKRLRIEETHLNTFQIWKIVEQLPMLEDLWLSRTRLKSIPDFAFQNSHYLKEVYLAENNILQLSFASFWGLQDTVQIIDLLGNNLTIDTCFFDNFTRLQEISITAHCDCQLLWSWDIIRRRKQYYLENLLCSSPESLMGTSLRNLTHDMLHCPSNYTEHSCPTYNFTMTTMHPSDTTPGTTQKTSTPVTKIHLYVIRKEAYSITLAWVSSMDRSSITGFVLQYNSSEENIVKTKKFHAETIYYTLDDLKSNTMYEICIYMEINKTMDTTNFQCLREITQKVEVSDSQNLLNPVLIGICVGGAIFLILAIAIILIVVKYNILKKKTDDQNGGYASVQDLKVSVIPNNYTDLKNLQQSSCLNDRDRGVHDHRMAQTNLAPSILNAGQLLRSTSDPNRPLPATPIIPGPSDACSVAETSVFYKENTDEIYIDFCK